MRVVWRVLGEFEGRCGDEALALGHARQRCVLAVLLLAGGRTVPVDRLIERVWGDHRSESKQRTLYGYLSRLRLALHESDSARIVRSAGGYALRVDPADVDLYRYRDLVAQARAAADDAEADSVFEAASRLWQGEPFAYL